MRWERGGKFKRERMYVYFPSPAKWLDKLEFLTGENSSTRAKAGKAAGSVGGAVILDSTKEIWWLVLSYLCITHSQASQMVLVVKNPPANAGDYKSLRFDPWRRAWQPTPVFLPGESHRWRNLVGYRPWGHKELEMTEWLFSHYRGCLFNLLIASFIVKGV